MAICRSFAQSGKCRNGASCFMSHEIAAVAAPSTSTKPADKGSWRTRHPELVASRTPLQSGANASLVHMQASSRQLSIPQPATVRSQSSVAQPSRAIMDRSWRSSTPAVPVLMNLTRTESVVSTGSGLDPEQIKTELYKTEMCRTWVKLQACPYGLKCQFAHGPGELRQVVRHPKHKTVQCKQWQLLGHCTFGQRCVFIHEESISAAAVRASNPASMDPATSWLAEVRAPYVAPTSSDSLNMGSANAKRVNRFGDDVVVDDLGKHLATSFPTFGRSLIAKYMESQGSESTTYAAVRD